MVEVVVVVAAAATVEVVVLPLLLLLAADGGGGGGSECTAYFASLCKFTVSHTSRRCSHAGELHLPLLRTGFSAIAFSRRRVRLFTSRTSLFLLVFVIIFFIILLTLLLPPFFFLLLLFSSSLTLANVAQPLVRACLRECVRKVRDLGGAGRLSRD